MNDDNLKPFKKGQSGNPGGRPKEVAEVKALARAHTTTAIETLVSIAKSKKATDAARVSACTALLETGAGRSRSSLNERVRSVECITRGTASGRAMHGKRLRRDRAPEREGFEPSAAAGTNRRHRQGGADAAYRFTAEDPPSML